MEWLNKVNAVFQELGFENLTLQSVFLVAFLPISIVYALGRGLNVLKTQFSKNLVAIVTVVLFSVLEVLELIPSKVSNILFLCSTGFFIYVALWQKFYSRIDNKLDKCIGKDSELKDENGFDSKPKEKLKKK